MKKTGWKLLMMLIYASIASGVNAAGTKTVELQLHLVVTQPPPCTVGDVIEPLETVPTAEPSHPPHPFTIPITCLWDVREAYRSLKLQIQGTTTTINHEQVLQTSEPDLGIRIEDEDGALVPLGTGNGITLNTADRDGRTYDLVLVARPVSRLNDEIFAPQEYRASAITILEYE